jgi:hypothetical protein
LAARVIRRAAITAPTTRTTAATTLTIMAI